MAGSNLELKNIANADGSDDAVVVKTTGSSNVHTLHANIDAMPVPALVAPVTAIFNGQDTVTTAGTLDPNAATDNHSQADAAPLRNQDNRIEDTEHDWYVATVAPGESIEFSITFTHLDGDLDMLLTDASGTELEISGTAADEEWIEWTNGTQTEVTVYIQVFPYQDDRRNRNTYTLEVN